MSKSRRKKKQERGGSKLQFLSEVNSASNDHKIGFILGVPIAITRLNEVLTEIDGKVGERTYLKPFFIATVNPEFIMIAQEDDEFKTILNLVDLPLPEGAGLRLGVKRISEIIPGRVLVKKLLEISRYRFFYLGGRGGVAREMADRYKGWSDEGSPDIKSEIRNSKDQTKSNIKILNKINRYRPDILLVAYGAPWQEKWIARNLGRIKARVVIGVGGTFDYLTGRAKEPPEWVSRAGCEWLWRLVHEPWRWRRQLRLIKYVVRIVGS